MVDTIIRLLIWAVQGCSAFLISLFCYVTNPLVVLFADENGELHGFLSYWQTWDNSCNPVDVWRDEQLPRWLLFPWYKYYEEYEDTTPELEAVGRKRWFTKKLAGQKLTLKDRFLRYVYRVYWLTRNCGYGFAFWWFGVNSYATDYDIKDEGDTVTMTSRLDCSWCYSDNRKILTICGYNVYNNIYIGWKVMGLPDKLTRSSIAIRVLAWKLRRAENGD